MLIFLGILVKTEGQAFEETPNITLSDENSKNVKLAKTLDRSKINVISFWATWCKPCITELGVFSSKYEEWKTNYNMEIVAISVDDPKMIEKAKSLAKSRNWNFPLFFDVNGKAPKAFNFEGIPYTIVLDQKGEIIYSHNSYLRGDESKMIEAIASN